jgi:hypothetical protein
VGRGRRGREVDVKRSMAWWLIVSMLAGGALVGCGGDKPDCKKGKPCGQTCIDKDDTCHK